MMLESQCLVQRLYFIPQAVGILGTFVSSCRVLQEVTIELKRVFCLIFSSEKIAVLNMNKNKNATIFVIRFNSYTLKKDIGL